MLKKASENTLNDFYRSVLLLAGPRAEAVFTTLDVEGLVTSQRKNFVHFITLVQRLYELSQLMDREEAQGLRQNPGSVLGTNSVQAQVLAGHIKVLEEAIVQRIRDLLEGGKINFSYEDILRLKDMWGDLEPVYTLIARFQGKANWRKELPVLGRVFQTALEGSFHNYKYRGFSEDRGDQKVASNQLGSLTESEIALWRRNAVVASVFNQSGDASSSLMPEERLSAIQDIARDNFVPHLREEYQNRISPNGKEGFEAHLSGWLGGENKNPKDFMTRFIGHSNTQLDEEEKMRLVAFVLFLGKSLSETKTFEEVQNIATLINFVSGRYGNKNPLWPDQVTQDIQSMYRIGQVSAPKKGEQGLVLSVIADAPRLLVTIGDAVNTSSCQNYRTGSYIHTLLGYVIDANVKGMLSYAVNAGDFEKGEDYGKIYQLIQRQEAIRITFDGNRRVFCFEWAEGSNKRRVVTRSLHYAWLRQILKLGRTNQERPALFLEREYKQLHPALAQMRAQHQALLTALAEQLNAATTGPMIFAASRNPGGVYSDKAGGVKTKEYGIEK